MGQAVVHQQQQHQGAQLPRLLLGLKSRNVSLQGSDACCGCVLLPERIVREGLQACRWRGQQHSDAMLTHQTGLHLPPPAVHPRSCAVHTAALYCRLAPRPKSPLCTPQAPAGIGDSTRRTALGLPWPLPRWRAKSTCRECSWISRFFAASRSSCAIAQQSAEALQENRRPFTASSSVAGELCSLFQRQL